MEMPNQQEPIPEGLERLAEGMPGLHLGALAVGLQDHQRMLRDHAKRVRESHLFGMRAAGATPKELSEGEAVAEGDDMGGIYICGDIIGSDAKVPWERKGESQKQQPQSPPRTEPPRQPTEQPPQTTDQRQPASQPGANSPRPGGWWATLQEAWPWILAAVIGSGATGAGSAYWFSKPTADTDTRSTLRPYDGPEPDTRK